MKKAVIFGATSNIERVEAIQKSYDVVFAVDNDKSKMGKYLNDSIPIKDVSELSNCGFDCVVIASIIAQEEMYSQLVNDFQIDERNIVLGFVDFQLKSRVQFLASFSQIAHDQKIQGSVCEVGVFRGEFAKEINQCFSDRKCYLFDTFEGFDARDIEKEKNMGYSSGDGGHLNITSTELVLAKMKHKDKIVIKKGYFPETFDIGDEKFCFVNLDVDLYLPIKEGLRIFWPLLSIGGVILVHDYFHPAYKGVKAAVDEFAKENTLCFVPIGDSISVAFIKQAEVSSL
ncbi:MAG: TylF/MycF family methyltransferase [Lachnospiraceae bacterium]|jgi:O-methyltransferase|nr:TylF/MycF family methyltransferase [Lachnospiraceae bacterium]